MHDQAAIPALARAWRPCGRSRQRRPGGRARCNKAAAIPGLWGRLAGLAPGQAIVSFPHMARPLLVSVDPTPAKLRLVD